MVRHSLTALAPYISAIFSIVTERIAISIPKPAIIPEATSLNGILLSWQICIVFSIMRANDEL